MLVSLLPLFLYFKNEFILLAFLKLRKQDFDGAKKWLAFIKNPESALVRKQQGYFNYLHGIMLSQTNVNQSEKYFKKAIEAVANQPNYAYQIGQAFEQKSLLLQAYSTRHLVFLFPNTV